MSLCNGGGVTQDKTKKNVENKEERKREKPRLEPNKIALEGTAFLQQDSVGCIPDARTSWWQVGANIVSVPRETIAACSSYIAKLRASPHATKSQPG